MAQIWCLKTKFSMTFRPSKRALFIYQKCSSQVYTHDFSHILSCPGQKIFLRIFVKANLFSVGQPLRGGCPERAHSDNLPLPVIFFNYV